MAGRHRWWGALLLGALLGLLSQEGSQQGASADDLTPPAGSLDEPASPPAAAPVPPAAAPVPASGAPASPAVSSGTAPAAMPLGTAPAGAAQPQPSGSQEPLPARAADVPKPQLSADEWWSRALGLDRAPLCGAPKAPVCTWSGDVTLRFKGRYTDSDSDSDLYQHLRLRYRREDATGLSGSVHLRVSEDLDGLDDSAQFFVFDSIDDTYDSAVVARLYHAYVNYRTAGGALEQVRAGRQYITAGDVFQVDGAHATFAPSGRASLLRAYLFGGVPTHLFDTSLEGDWIFGAGVSFTPWRGASLEISDVYLEDQNNLYGGNTANLLAVEGSQRLSCWGTLRGAYQHLDAEPRRASVSLDAYLARYDATLRAALFTQILNEREQVYDIDPYFAILIDQAPYWDARLSAGKGLTRCLHLEGGLHTRKLYDQADQGVFNREFVTVYGTLSSKGWPWNSLGLALTGEWWSAEAQEDVFALGFEADWRSGRRWRFTAGTDYSLYRTDFYAAAERYHNYGWYLRTRWQPRACWELDGSVRVDDDDFDTYLTVTLAARYEF